MHAQRITLCHAPRLAACASMGTMPPRVLAAISDLFFAVKVNDVLKKRGLELKLAKSADDLLEKLAAPTSLIIVDLNDRAFDALSLVQRLKQSEATRAIPVLAFSSHVQADTMAAARAAGVETVVPRSVFADRLPELIAQLIPTTTAPIPTEQLP